MSHVDVQQSAIIAGTLQHCAAEGRRYCPDVLTWAARALNWASTAAPKATGGGQAAPLHLLDIIYTGWVQGAAKLKFCPKTITPTGVLDIAAVLSVVSGLLRRTLDTNRGLPALRTAYAYVLPALTAAASAATAAAPSVAKGKPRDIRLVRDAVD